MRTYAMYAERQKKEVYHFFRAMLTKIHCIKINHNLETDKL